MISIVKVRNKDDGQDKAHELLKKLVDDKTLLAISGGTSIDYRKMIVDAGGILSGAVCIVDERFGKEFHANSNELLLKNAGIIDYLRKNNIRFHKILYGDDDIVATACDYNTLVQELFERFSKHLSFAIFWTYVVLLFNRSADSISAFSFSIAG